MFQYDSRSTAEWNTDWDAHYLNLLYTPGKAVSLLIGGQVFREIPRGAFGNPDHPSGCETGRRRMASEARRERGGARGEATSVCVETAGIETL